MLRPCCGTSRARSPVPVGALAGGEVAECGVVPVESSHVRLPAKIDKAVLDHILTRTNLGPKEIKDLYKRFRKIAPDGSLPFSRFCETLGVLGMVDDTFLAERLFNAFDTNGDSRLSFTEFAVALGIMMRGSDDEKLDLSFKILNPTYGGVVTCLTDYGLTSFEVCDDAVSEVGKDKEPGAETLRSPSSTGAVQPVQSSLATPGETRKAASENSSTQSPNSSAPRTGKGAGGGMSSERYGHLKDQIERDSIGFDDFVQLIRCVDATRKALVGGSVGISSDSEKIRKVFLQNSTPMPDGTSRMMLLDFKHAVRTSPAFLALLGVLPQELAVDTSAGHQCFPTGRRTFTFPAPRSPPMHYAVASVTADTNRETMAAIQSELKVVKEELEQVMDYVVTSALAAPSSPDTQNQSSCLELHPSGSHGGREGRDDGSFGARAMPVSRPGSPGAPGASGSGGLLNSLAGYGRESEEREKGGGDRGRSKSTGGGPEHNGRLLGAPGGLEAENKADDGLAFVLEFAADSSAWSVSSQGSSNNMNSSSLARGVEEFQPQRTNGSGHTRPLGSCRMRNPLSPRGSSAFRPSGPTSGDVLSPHPGASRRPSVSSRGSTSMGSPALLPQAADMNQVSHGGMTLPPNALDAAVGMTGCRGARMMTRGVANPASQGRPRSDDNRGVGGGIGGTPGGKAGLPVNCASKNPAASDAITRIRDMESRINHLLSLLKDERSRLTPLQTPSSPVTTRAAPFCSGGFREPHNGTEKKPLRDVAPAHFGACGRLTSDPGVFGGVVSRSLQKKGETSSSVTHVESAEEATGGGRACGHTAAPGLATRSPVAGMRADTPVFSNDTGGSSKSAMMKDVSNKDPGAESEERSGRGSFFPSVAEGRGGQEGFESSEEAYAQQMEKIDATSSSYDASVHHTRLCGADSQQELARERDGRKDESGAVDRGQGPGQASSGGRLDTFTTESSVRTLQGEGEGKGKQGRRFSSRISSYKRQTDSVTRCVTSGENGTSMKGKRRSLVSKKVTIRLKDAVVSAASQVDQLNDSDGSSLGEDVLRRTNTMGSDSAEGGSALRPVRMSLSAPSMRAADALHIHRMYMNRANLHRLHTKEGRRRRRTILPMKSLVVLKREASSGLRPAPASKGLAVHFGHENWNTVINIMVGIRLAAGRASSEPQRAVDRYDFVMKEKFSILPNTGMVDRARGGRRSLCAVRFVDYAPMVFRRLREKFQISSEMYVRSVGPEQLLGNLFLGNLSSLSELVSEGKSGALFYYTADGKFMIKTISKDTALFLRSVLLDYYQHVMSNPDTLLTRFFGLHAIRLKEKSGGGVPLTTPPVAERRLQKTYFIVMVNFFHTPVEIHRRYDLKGSSYKRQLPPDQLKDNTVALKDLDMDREGDKIELGPERRARMLAQMQRDVDFLKKHEILDYSLLLGIFYKDRDPEHHDSECFPTIPLTPTSQSAESSHGGICRSYSFGSQSAPETPHTPFFQADHGGMRSVDRSKLYYVGIIDILTRWGPKKKLEHVFKTVQTGDPKGISCVNPTFYAERFMDFMRRHIC